MISPDLCFMLFHERYPPTDTESAGFGVSLPPHIDPITCSHHPTCVHDLMMCCLSLCLMCLIQPFCRIDWRNGTRYAVDANADAVRAISTERGRAMVWMDHDGGEDGEFPPHSWKTHLQDLLHFFFPMVLGFLNPHADVTHMVPQMQQRPIALFERAREELISLQGCLALSVRVELRYPQEAKRYQAKSITSYSAMSTSTARDYLYALRKELLRDDVRVLKGNDATSFHHLAQPSLLPLLTTQQLILALGSLPMKEGKVGIDSVQIAVVSALVKSTRETRPSEGDRVIVIKQGASPGQVQVGWRNSTVVDISKHDLTFVHSRIRWSGRNMSVRFYRSELKKDSVVYNALLDVGDTVSANGGGLRAHITRDYTGWPSE